MSHLFSKLFIISALLLTSCFGSNDRYNSNEEKTQPSRLSGDLNIEGVDLILKKGKTTLKIKSYLQEKIKPKQEVLPVNLDYVIKLYNPKIIVESSDINIEVTGSYALTTVNYDKFKVYSIKNLKVKGKNYDISETKNKKVLIIIKSDGDVTYSLEER